MFNPNSRRRLFVRCGLVGAVAALAAVMGATGANATVSPEQATPVTASEVSAAVFQIQNCDGRLEQFTFGGDRAMWHRWQSSPGSAFSSWASLGGVFIGDIILVGRNVDCRLEVFGIGTNHAMYHKWQSSPSAGPWSSNWDSLGGWLHTSPLGIGFLSDGRMFVQGVGSNGLKYRNQQSHPAAGPWTGWFRI